MPDQDRDTTYANRVEREVPAYISLLRRKPMLAVAGLLVLVGFLWIEFGRSLNQEAGTPEKPTSIAATQSGSGNTQVTQSQSGTGNSIVNVFPAPAPRREANMETRISTAHVIGGSLQGVTMQIQVMFPPTGDASISINGKDVSSFVESVKPYSSNTIYFLTGPPENMNVHVGTNSVAVSYGGKSLAPAELVYTEAQSQQVQRRAELRQRLAVAAARNAEPTIQNMAIVGDSVLITVVKVPTENPTFLFNGKRVNDFLASVSGDPLAKSYALAGTAQQLNLHVGKNVIAVRYGEKVLESADFIYTQSQKETADFLNRQSGRRERDP